MAQDLLNNDLHVNGTLSCKTFNPPSGSITNAAVLAAAGIDASKVVSRKSLAVSQAPGTAVVAATTHLHIVRAAGTVVAVEAATETPATGADRTVTVDLQKSTSAGAFATVLSAPITLNNTSTARTVYSGAISSTAVVDNDLLRLVVTVAGAAGAQAQGLLVTVTLDENPQ
jgi:hypothetical protein